MMGHACTPSGQISASEALPPCLADRISPTQTDPAVERELVICKLTLAGERWRPSLGAERMRQTERASELVRAAALDP